MMRTSGGYSSFEYGVGVTLGIGSKYLFSPARDIEVR